MVGGLWPSGGGPRVLRLPRRRREAPLELGVLARPLLEVCRAGPRARLGLGLERVLLAGVLCGRGVWRDGVAASGGLSERKISESFGRSRGVTRRLRFSREVFGAFAVRAAFWQPWCVLGALAATGDKKASFLGTDPRRQCFGLQHLRESLTLRLADGLVGHFAQPVRRCAVPGRDYGRDGL